MPVELSKVTHKIANLEREVEQLEQCKKDVSENLFDGLDDEASASLNAGNSFGNLRKD